MSERPILFTGDMVKAILDGRKTQTRRVIKPQPPETYEQYEFTGMVLKEQPAKWCGKEYWNYGARWGGTSSDIPFPKCPYGKVGDLLWVREKHSLGGNGIFFPDSCDGTVHIAWTPARFMKKIYARIWLEITGIRVERLQEITENDALKEGAHALVRKIGYMPSAKYGFEQLWDSINGKKYPWKDNPWVWVIEFKETEK